jgi:proton glutamate symport protein
MAHTVGTQGFGVLVNLSKLIGSLYLALAIFILSVFGLVIWIAAVPVWQFVRAVREPAALAFATTSSESALPKAMESMERFGVPPYIVGFVMPTGYSFNLTGSTLYLAMASVFVAQAAETTMGWHMSLGQQMMMTLMLTFKGVAGVPRASLVILLGALNSFIPSGVGADWRGFHIRRGRIDGYGRTCVNVIGNCLATVVVARWEGEFDDTRARVFGTPAEAELDLRRDEVAFADALKQGD